MIRPLVLLLLTVLVWPRSGAAQDPVVLDNFESYAKNALPERWKYLEDGALVPLEERHMRPREQFFVVDGQGGRSGSRALRVYTEGEAVHLTMGNEPDGFDWNIKEHPRLGWDWRALRLPERAREDREEVNDTGVALYVIFKLEGVLFKRPKAIKYTYSSTLPVGTTVDYGKLKVLVVSSAVNGEIGNWQRLERDVVEDYRLLFGEEPPEEPLSIRLWSDSDNTRGIGEAEFDNIRFLPQR